MLSLEEQSLVQIACTTTITSSVPGQRGKRMEEGRIIHLSPLCVVVDMEQNLICHSPRRIRTRPEWVVDWLTKHPEWPAILELDAGYSSQCGATL